MAKKKKNVKIQARKAKAPAVKRPKKAAADSPVAHPARRRIGGRLVPCLAP